ncbi:Nucleotide-binding oligomerization domain-containing protein 1 [Folsomia candida]|uniref:Nucleotide-binding oligomerization domain-containing protein 1 n=1 Tax=Folsomia candida TaxID=158441 RepID=A0A226E3V7_FOLCA|nr:Nucleotide-binding oligomerization domain-containing protein 1 [Folsomia candida]
MTIDQPTILQNIIKENRKLLQDHLKNVLTVADHLFERGHFRRSDYHEIDQVELATERCNKFLDILVSKNDDTVLDEFIDYLGQTKSKANNKEDKSETLNDSEKANNTDLASYAILFEKLTLSRDKFASKISNVDGSTTPAVIIDSADFTLTPKALDEICTRIILKNEKAKKNWSIVISNMNGLEDVELLTYHETSDGERNRFDDDNNLLPMKMRLRFKGEHQTIQNYIHCINWEEIAHKCFALWKERNGTNATFFSLVGIFQHSQLTGIAGVIFIQIG